MKAADLVWDSDSVSGSPTGGDGAWDTTSTFWDNSGSMQAWINAFNYAYFGGTAGAVNVVNPVQAGGLVFTTTGYSVTGSSITLAPPAPLTSPTIHVNPFTSATISADIAGSNGFTKTGNGTLRLTNSSNSFTGDLSIRGGNLVVSSVGALGMGTTAISVTGVANTGNPGFSGGSLVLDGALSGITLNREVSVSGRGPGASNATGGLVSVGYNTLAGGLTLGSSGSEGRALATHGISTISGGGLYLGTGGSNILWGNGNWIVSGQVTGSEISNDRFVKSGNLIGSTLWLQNESNSFAESLRIDSGTVRVSTNTALGRNLGTQSLDLNNGGLEVRTDTPGIGNADFSTRKVFNRDNTNTGVFVGAGIGGTAINQTVTFGETRMTGTNTNFRLTGRNGYNATFTGVGNSALGLMGQGGTSNALIENNSSGLLTLATSSLWNQTDGTSRTLTIQGNGETTLTGNISATSGGTGHNFTKAGSGVLVFQGTASTFAGSASVNGGTLSIGTIGALNANSTGRVVFGGGTLNYTGSGETWANKVLLMNATNSIVTNNGNGALTLSQNVGNNGNTARNFVLGGSNTGINNLTGIVVNTNLGAGLTKIGSGTWQITAPGTGVAQIGTANAALTITAIGGTASQTVTTPSTAGLVVGQTVSGTGVPFGTVISQIISATQFATSQGLTSTGTSLNIGTVNGSTAALNVTANTANLLTVASTANLVPGQYISGVGLSASDGWFISQINSATTFTVANSTNTAALANTAAVGAQNPLNSPNFGGNLTISNGILRLNPTAAGLGSDIINNGSAVTFAAEAITGAGNAAGVLDYRGFTGGSSEILGRLSVTAGNATVRITPVGGTNVLTFGSLAAPSLGSSLNFDVPGSPGTNSVVITKGMTAGLVNAHAYYNGSNFAYSLGGADAVLRAPVYGTDAGFAAVNTLTAANSVAIDANAATGGALAVTSLKISGDSTLTLAGLLTVGSATGGGILVDSATTGATISGTGVTTGSGGDLAIRVNGAGDVLTLSAPVTSTTTGGITKNGAGTLVLNATNAQTGAFTINEGTVRLSGTATLGVNSGATTPAVTLRQNSVLDLGGVSGLVSGVLTGSGTVTNTGAASTWTIGNNNGTGVFSGVISNGTGILGVTKSGTGTQSFSGANTYTGVTTINTGTLAVTDIAAVSGIAATTNLTSTPGNTVATVADATGLVVGQTLASNSNIAPGTTITAINGNDITLSRPALGTASTVSTAFGAVSSLGWSGAAAGNLVFNGGTLLYTGSNAGIFRTTQTPSVNTDRQFTLAGNGTIQSSGQYGSNVLGTGAANNAALIFGSTADLSFSGAGTRTLTLGGNSIGDNMMNIRLRNNPNAGEALSLTKADAGLWILGNAGNDYTGTTTISGGALRGQDGSSLPTASNLLLNGGVFETSGTFDRNLGAGADQYRFVSSGNGGFSSANSKLILDLAPLSTPTWGGTANFINAGALILNSTTSLADVEVAGNFNLAAGGALAPTITTVNANSGITITAGGNTSGLTIGQAITGTNIPAGSYITAITGATTFNISQNATGPGTGIAATIPAGGWREIQVNDNTSTNLDFASISGVIGGTGGLGKIGGGTLILGNANTYSGNTIIRQESVIATSIGAAGATATSFGTNVGGGIIELGNPGNTTTANLMYVGPGETTTRQINLTGTTGTRRIDSSGSGPLVLTNLLNTTVGSVNTTGGAKTLELRGTNTDLNIVTSTLTDNGGALSVQKIDGGVWVLNPSVPNTFTGGISVNQGSGLLGLTANGIGSASGITLTNGGIFAYGGPLVTNKPLFGNNASSVFAGSNAMTFNANVTKTAGNNQWTLSNNLEGGALLTINGNFINAEAGTSAAAQTISIRGYGSWLWNGAITENAAAGGKTAWNIAIASDASFTTTGAANTYSNTTTLTNGILILDKTTTPLGTGTFAFNGGTLRAGSSIVSPLVITNPTQINASPPKVDGTKAIEFSNSVTLNASRNLQNEIAGQNLVFSGTITNSAASTLTIYGSGNTLVSGNVTTGTGAQGLQLSGTGLLSLTGTNLATGALTASRSTITLSGTSGGSWNAGTIALNPTGTITLDNSVLSGGNNAAGRLNDAGGVTGNGGTLHVINNGTATSEVTGALTLNTVQTKITMAGAGTTTLTFGSVLSPNSGSSLDLSTISSLGGNNKVLFTAALPANFQINGVMPRTFINGGADFATYNAVNGVQAFTSYVTDVNTATATQTVEFTSNSATTGNRTVNAIKINGNGLTISGGASNRLILGGITANVGASAILNTGGDNTLSVNEVALGANTGFIQVAPSTTLTLNSSLTGSAGLAKALSGSLTFGSGVRSFVTSTHNLLEGTVNLNGGADTLFPNFGQLTLNVGSTLNLNGGGQYIGVLASAGALPGGGGTINGGGAIVTNGGGTFAGIIESGTALGRVGGGTLTLSSAQTYTGTTLLMGGTTSLENDATILSTSEININNATFFLGNNSNLQTQINNRVGDTIPLNLRGGTVSVTGRLSTAATEVFGVVNALQGANTITATTGGGTFNSLDLTFASLNRSAGAIVNFTGTALGQEGNAARIKFTTPLSTVAGGALGGWAIANTTDFAAYNTALGVGVVGMGGFAGYDSAFAAGNITELPGFPNATSLTTLPTGTTTTGLLKFAGNNFNNLAFTAGSDVLDLEHGGLLRSNNLFGTNIGTSAVRGILTAGGADPSARELFVFNNGSTNPTFTGAVTTIGSPIVTGINTAGLQPGMSLTNVNFPAGTKVVSIINNAQVLLSNNATASTTAQTLTAGALDTGSTITGSAVITMASTVGVSPGMTLTGTGIPANSFVVSVDSPTQLTLSQNATATASNTITFTAGLSNVVINSVIADNPVTSAPVSLVKSGAGVLTLTAPNSYTGGTVISGPVNLASPGTGGIASHVVIPAGGITINNAAATMLTNSGQIAASNDVTLRGGSSLTMVGNNTLSSLAFDNNGGTGTPTVTSGGLLTLTHATPITVTSSNPSTVATIAGNIDIGSGLKTINTPAIQVGGVTVTNIVPTLSISANILSPGATLTKTGNGLLQLGGQSTFTGGVNLNAGGIVIGSSSSPAQGGTGITSGPLGSGTLTAVSGTRILTSGTFSLANDVSFGGTPNFDSTANTVWTLSLNGAVSGAGWTGTPTVNVANPGLTVALLGDLPAFSNITKTGLGALIFNASNYSGDFNATALGNAAQVQLLHDGNGTGSVETLSLGNVTFDAGVLPNIVVNRAGGSLPFNLAANKIISPASVSNLGLGISVTNNNGYGLAVGDAVTFAGLPAITVSTATASDVTQGLYLNGVLGGIGFVKTGEGTAVLGNASNSFTGNVNINQGVISVDSNAVLGSGANQVLLNPQTGTAAFRATESFLTSRVFQLSNTANLRAIEVTNGKTLTLNSAFDLNGGAGNAASLLKRELGTLVLGASNSGWSGVLTINAGAVSTSLASSLGTGAVFVNETSAALQLNGGISVANPITIDVLANGRTLTGLNTGGAIQSVTGVNTISSAVTVNATTATDSQSRNFGFGANSGATLNLGNINLNHPTGGTSRNIIGYFNTPGTGAINLTGALDNANASPGANTFLFKIGDGTMTLSAVNAIPDTEVRIYRGNMTLNSAATFGNSAAATQVQVWQNGSLTLDNSATNTANRLSNRILQLGGGTVNFIPNAAGTSQVSTGALQISQGTSTINLAAGGNQTVTFASLTQNAGATLNLTGTFGTANNRLTFTTAPANVPAGAGGLLARVTTNGNEFATYNATTGVSTFTGYAPATNVLSASATQTYRATAATANSLTGNQTLNAINLQSGPLAGNVPNIGGLGGLIPTTLTLTSGGILASGTGAGMNSALSVPVVAFGGVEAIVHVTNGQTLNVSSGFTGTAGLTKSLNGTLNLNQQQFVSGNTIVNGGTLNLQAGATNTLFFNNGLGINSGATVDLKNGVQFVSSLFSSNGGGNTDLGGGILTNSGAEATFVTNSNSSFNGQINGSIFLNKTGVNSLNLQSANSYSGNTLITGGTLNLSDDGTILNTTAIGIQFGTLSMSNTSLRDNTNRVNDSASITMRTGTLNFAGRAQAYSSETLGAVTLVDGRNNIFSNDADIGIGAGVLTLASLTRSVGSTATLRFNNPGDMGAIGTRGRVMITSNPTLTNSILGPWAVIDREWASYDSTYGVGGLNQTGFAGYSGSGLNTSPSATDNVRFSATGTTLLAANTTVGTLMFAQQNAATTLNLNGKTLTIQGGGLALAQATDNVTFAITNGTLTGPAGGGDLYIHHLNYSGTNRLASIDAVIADNGGPIRVIKSSGDTGASVMTWNGVNTYTGGTIIDQGTLVIGATGALGTGGVTISQATLTQTPGGVIPASNILTLGGSSTVNLANQANSLAGLVFNNLGGSSPTLNPTGTLTLTGGTSVTTENAGAIATIGAGILDLNGSGAYSVNVGATLVNGQDVAPWQAGLIINSTIQNGGITKSGAGVLQLGGLSSFAGGVNVTAGGLILASDTNSAVLYDPVVTGPVGTGTLTMADGTTLLAGGAARTITNNVTFGDDGLGTGNHVFNGINNLTLNGITTLPSIWNATVTAPQMTVTIGDASPSGPGDVINKSGLGILSVGNYAGTINAAGGLLFTGDGNTLGTLQSINLGGNVNISGDTAITVNRSGGAPNSRNKLLQKVDLINGGSIMSVNNLNGFGLEFTGTTTLNGASHFAVSTATASNVVQGLTLTGQVTDAGGYSLVKSGPGTFVLSDPTNTFGGTGATIDILGGVVSVPNDGALGNALNTITLNADASTGVGLRATGTFSTARTIILNQANNAIEVTAGNVLTLTSALSVPTGTNTLTKNDNGVVAFTVANPGTWTGGVTINAGAIRVSDAGAFGASTSPITISPATSATGAALQLAGVTLANPVNLQGNNNQSLGGINFGGQLESFSGVNTTTGVLRMDFDAAIGARTGSTLNINGGISNPTASGRALNFNVEGTGVINVNSNLTSSTGTANQFFAVRKYGSGTLNFTTANTVIPTDANTGLQVFGGTLALNGDGRLAGGNTISMRVLPGATLAITDDSAAPTSNRLGGRPVALTQSTFTYQGSGAGNSAETAGILTIERGGSTITTNAGGANNSTLTFASLAFGTESSVNFTGTALGTSSNRVMFTTAPTLVPATTGILPRATVNGADFATYGGTNGIAAFTAYQTSNNPNTAAATDTMSLTVDSALTANRVLNAVKLSGTSAVTLGGAAFSQLTLTAGGIIATGAASHVINVPVLLGLSGTTSVQQVYHVDTGTTLTLDSTLTGTAGLVKAGNGTLVISPNTLAGVSHNTLSGNVSVNGGTLKLDSTNAILPGQFLIMNGGTLDLAGNSQQFRGIFTDSSVDGAGGIITSSTGTGNLVENADGTSRNWAGSIQGDVNYTRSGDATKTIYTPQNYTGATLINGGTTNLRNGALILGNGSLDINFATLSADNNAGTIDLGDRIDDDKAITLRGGTLTIQGRAQTASSEALGSVSADLGFNVINPLVGGTGINSVDVSLTSLSRPANSAATLIVQGTNLGTLGSSSRVTVGTLNGVPTTPVVYSRNGSGLTENLVGPWAISSTNEFLTYIPGLGLAPLNQVGAPQYDRNNTFIGSLATDNVRLSATTSVPNGGATVNAVSMSGSNIALNFATSTDTLNIVSGGLIGPNNNQSIGAAVDTGRITAGGLTPGLASDLYLYNRANTLTLNSRLIDNVNGGGSAVRAVFTASGGAINLTNTNASYTGGTVLNGGTLNLVGSIAGSTIPLAADPANGFIINGGTVTMGSATNSFSQQIAAGNVVTLNGVSTLSLSGNNTLEGLVFNNIGGGSGNVQVLTYSTVNGAGANGILSIGDSGIKATSSNVAGTGVIVGRADFGATAKTIDVAPILINGISVAPLQAAFALQGVVNSTGGITKVGNGVLQFSAQAHYTGPTTVNAGGIRTGVTNGGSRFSALDLNGATTTLNLAGANTTWGSLAGSGTVFNSGGAATLTVGFDNTSTTFSGQLARFNDAVVNGVGLQKVGTGTMSMTSAQSFATGTTGAITVQGGTLRYTGAGAAFAGTTGTGGSGGGTFNVNNNGILALDNATTSNVNNRLGLNAVGTLALQGGKLTLNGNGTAATPTTEQITTFTLNNGGGRVELTPDALNPLTLAITTLSGQNNAGSMVITGITGAASANGVARLTIATPNLIGGQGTGANGTATMAVRSDILADASISGLGTGFLVKDSVTNNYRALGTSSAGAAVPGEFETAANTAALMNWGATENVKVASAQTIFANTPANTLTFEGVSSITSALGTAFGNYGPGGTLLTQNLSGAAGLLVLNGATASIGTAGFAGATAGTTLSLHMVGTGALNIGGAFGIGNTGGISKSGGGTLSLNNRAYYTGVTTINNGIFRLNSGTANTLVVAPTTGGATVSTQVSLNGTGSVLDLMGKDQAIGILSSINPIPGSGGTIQSTGGAAILSLNGSGTFSGVISGAIALTRAGNNTTTLTNANTYTGATIVRGGTLQLRDSGTLASTAGLTLNYGTLNWDNFGLNPNGTPNPVRIAAANAVTMQGGAFTINGAGSTDTTATLDSVTVTGGQNTFNVLPYINEGSTVKLTIGNLIRNASNHSGVNFNGFSQNNSGGASTLGGQGLTQNGTILLNQINSAAGPVSFVLAATTTANSATVTVPSTAGLVVGMAVNGANIPVGATIATIPTGTTFTLNSGTGVVAGTAVATNVNSGLTNNLIGGWAVADGNTFATYVTGAGVSVMSQTTQGIVAPNFTGTNLSSATIASGNYSDGADRTLTTGIKAANSWRLAGGTTAQTITPVSGTSYTFGVGIITNQNIPTTLAAVDATNTITGTGTDLYFYVNQNTTVIRPAIIGSSSLVSNGPSTLSLRPQFASNSYTGGTFINAGTTTLLAEPGLIAIPGDLTINNATVTMTTNAGQIAAASNVAINGGGVLNMTGTNTLNSVTFNNEGGAGTPTLATSTLLILSSATPVTSVNNSLATTPLISGTALQFSDANPVITVNDGLAETELTISAPITQHASMLSLTKSGTGALALSGASTFTTGFLLDQGSLIFGISSTGTLPAVTNGPVGTGTLTISGGTSLLSDGTIRTIGNATIVNGDFTFGGRIAGNGVILSGAMNLGSTGRTITVSSPAVTSTISGAITSAATGTALTKAGNGTLTLSSATSNFGGAGVAVTGGILKNGVDNAIPVASALAVAAGTGYDVNGFNQTLDGISGAGFITQSANNTRTLTISSAVTNSTFDGILTDNRLAQSASALSLTKVGAATTLTLTNANSHSGTTTVTSGMISISNGGALGTTTGGTVVASGGSLELQNDITVGNEALSIAGTGSASNGALRNLSGNNVYGGLITLTGAATIQSDAGLLTLDVASGNAVAGTNQNLTVQGSGNVTIADAIATGTGTLTKIGDGTLVLSGANTYSGVTNVEAGIVIVSNSTGLGTTAGATTVTAGATLNINAVTVAENVTLNGTGVGSNGALTGTGVSEVSGTVTLASNSSVGTAGAPDILTISGAISDGAGTNSLTKVGDGTVILSAANDYDGATVIAGGNLTLTAGGSIKDTSAVNLTGSTAVFDVAAITATGETVGSLAGVAGSSVVLGAKNLTVGGDNSTTAFAGVISGTDGSLTKVGTGTMTLSGANTYTGATNVDAGMLMIDGIQSAANGDVTVASGATLGGSGTIGGNTTIASGGTITAGNDGSSGTVGVLDPLVTDAVSTLTFNGDLTASSGSIWLVDLVQGVNSDLVNVGGALSIGGSTLDINFGGMFVEHQVYTIANYTGGRSGIFSGLSEGAFVDPGQQYRINYGTGIGSGAITLTAVPEPGTLGFLGLALAGFFTRRIRKRRAVVAQVASASQE